MQHWCKTAVVSKKGHSTGMALSVHVFCTKRSQFTTLLIQHEKALNSLSDLRLLPSAKQYHRCSVSTQKNYFRYKCTICPCNVFSVPLPIGYLNTAWKQPFCFVRMSAQMGSAKSFVLVTAPWSPAWIYWQPFFGRISSSIDCIYFSMARRLSCP